MALSRLFLPLLFAFTLLLAQQGSFAHALRHVMADQQQQDKQAPHSNACDQCASYAQLGGALNSACHTFKAISDSSASVQQFIVAFNSTHVLAASARGPPVFPEIA